MPSNDPMETYRSVGVTGGVVNADPHELISMLMQGVLDACATAMGLMSGELDLDAIAAKGDQIGRAISIVETLRQCLDHEAGADISAKLDQLYEYMSLRLLLANANNDTTLLGEVASLMREIKAGWDAIPEEARSLRKPEDTTRLEGGSQALGSC